MYMSEANVRTIELSQDFQTKTIELFDALSALQTDYAHASVRRRIHEAFKTTEGGYESYGYLLFGKMLTKEATYTNIMKGLEDIEVNVEDNKMKTNKRLSDKLIAYKKNIAALSDNFTRNIRENVKFILELLKEDEMDKYIASTPIPLPKAFEEVTDACKTVIAGLLIHHTDKYLQVCDEKDMSKLYDETFSGDVARHLDEIGIVKTEAGLPSFTGFDKIQYLKLDTTDIKEWIETLKDIEGYVKNLDMQDLFSYFEKLAETLDIVKLEEDNVAQQNAITLLVTTITQLALVELTAKSYLSRVIASIRKKVASVATETDPLTLSEYW